MNDNEKIYLEIDSLIQNIDNYKVVELFDNEKLNRQNKAVKSFSSDSEMLKNLSYLIAFSQNANSETVENVLKSKEFDKAFEQFDIDKVSKLNPCDIADNYWENIKGIRQQAKLFHIVSLARKIKRLGSLADIFKNANIPKTIKSNTDIQNFWRGFDLLMTTLKENKIPFFQSTTSLLHFLLDNGYDCVKPDLVVMRVAKKLNIVPDEKGEKNFRKTVKLIQEYSLDRNIRPTIVDFYFLIDEGQMGAKKFVREEFYNLKKQN